MVGQYRYYIKVEQIGRKSVPKIKISTVREVAANMVFFNNGDSEDRRYVYISKVDAEERLQRVAKLIAGVL